MKALPRTNLWLFAVMPAAVSLLGSLAIIKMEEASVIKEVAAADSKLQSADQSFQDKLREEVLALHQSVDGQQDLELPLDLPRKELRHKKTLSENGLVENQRGPYGATNSQSQQLISNTSLPKIDGAAASEHFARENSDTSSNTGSLLRAGLYLNHHPSLLGKEQRRKASEKLQSSMTVGGTRSGKPLKITSKYEEKTKFICKFCGGPPCPHEDWTKIKRPAIKGLNSNWINDDIVASQRLGEKLIREHDIIGQFKKLGIGAVINLQEPGEHPYCGEPVVPEWGFSYSSEGLNNRRLC